MKSLRIEESDRPRTYTVIQRHFRSRWLTENKPASEKITEYYESPWVSGGRQVVWIDRPARLFYYMAVD